MRNPRLLFGLLVVLACGVPTLEVGQAGSTNVQNVKTDHAAVGDAVKIEGVQTSIGSGIIATQVDTFVVGDVGKWGWCLNTGVAEAQPNIEWSQITAFTDARHVTFADGSNNTTGNAVCVFGTQDDTAAFQAAFAASLPPAGSAYPDGAPATFKGGSGTMYMPPGGYIVSGRIYSKLDAGSAPAPSLVGSGRMASVIFPRPDLAIPGDGTGVLVQATGNGATFKDFSVDCALMRYSGWGASQDMIRFINFAQFRISDMAVRYCGQDSSADAAVVAFHSASDGIVENLYVKDGPAPNLFISCKYNQSAAITNTNIWCSNALQSIVITNNLDRSPLTKPLLFVGGSSDECGHPSLGCLDLRGGEANFWGSTHWGGNATAPAVSVDGTSRLWILNGNVGAFNSASPATGLRIQAGGIVTSGSTTWHGNTPGFYAVHNLGTFVDLGGNQYENCVGSTCTAKTSNQAFQPGSNLPVRR